ncbi:helix-turn-helix domain-containing protein [Meiothermus rufus]|uniref:helix-turn-helix domain-containing protein n=1 Tax=Meiothermus rufus TaxID=604332 RepID=UPI0004000187|nr:helix-turn-helix domain-containing protein [Meiothermus rufus]
MARVYLPQTQQENLRTLLQNIHPQARLRVGEVTLEITPALAEVLRAYLEPLARGEVVQVIPLEAELTTQEAADLLGVSRPYLIRLLEKGQIAHRKVGTHRRIRAKDLLAYIKQSQEKGQEILDALIQEDQALGLGYQP